MNHLITSEKNCLVQEQFWRVWIIETFFWEYLLKVEWYPVEGKNVITGHKCNKLKVTSVITIGHKCNKFLNRIYNKILDRNWFSAAIFSIGKTHVQIELETV